jgi:dicarboxylate transporter 10
MNKQLHTPFYFGGAASCTAAMIVHPLDLTKVRLQNTKGINTNMFRTMLNIVSNEGFFAIYNGISAAIIRQATYSTVRLGGYEFLKEKLLAREKSKK